MVLRIAGECRAHAFVFAGCKKAARVDSLMIDFPTLIPITLRANGRTLKLSWLPCSRPQKDVYGCRMTYAGIPSFLSSGIRGRSHSTVLASSAFGPSEKG